MLATPLRFVLLLFLLAGLAACATPSGKIIEKPRIDLEKIRPGEVSLLRQNFILSFRVTNPNRVPLPVSGIKLNVTLMGKEVATALDQGAFSVPAGGATSFDATVSLNWRETLGPLVAWLGGKGEPLSWKVLGELGVDLPLVGPFRIEEQGSLALPPVLKPDSPKPPAETPAVQTL
ncbi:MAG: LEA type 2 family protein [Magnetococcales bacterium]|nr:LEA type 2 family protein [Magnetococcales bacterium]